MSIGVLTSGNIILPTVGIFSSSLMGFGLLGVGLIDAPDVNLLETPCIETLRVINVIASITSDE